MSHVATKENMTPLSPSLPVPFAQSEARIRLLMAQGDFDAALAMAQDVFAQEALAPLARRALLLADVLDKTARRGDAIALLQGIPLSAVARIFLAELLLRDDQKSAAVAALPDDATLQQLKTGNGARLLLRRAGVLLGNGNMPAARASLLCSAQAARDEPAIWFWITLAQYGEKAGLPDVILPAVFTVARADQTTAPQMQKALDIGLRQLDPRQQTGIPADVIAGIERHLAMPQAAMAFRLRFVQLLLRLGQQERARQRLAAEADMALERAAEVLLLIQLRTQAGAVSAADSTARRAIKSAALTKDDRVRVVQWLVQYYLEQEQNAAALALCQEAIAQLGVIPFEKKWVLLLRKLGATEALGAAAAIIQQAYRAELGATLAETLAAIPRDPGPEFRQAPLARQEAWRLSGRPEADWPDWSRRQIWGQSAAKILQSWGYYAGGARRAELLGLIDPMDLSPLRHAMARGRGVILAGTHMGPVAASFFAFETLEWPFAYLGQGGTAATTKAKGILLSEVGQHASIQQMRQHLETGAMLGMAVDGQTGGKQRLLHVNGVAICLSRLAARLSYSQGVPALWYQAEWIADRIKITLKPLPQPETDEPQSRYEDRLFQSYEAILRAYFGGAAENQTGFIPYKAQAAQQNAWILKA